MLNKWSFVSYVCSCLALLYLDVVNSPLAFAKNAWENTETPIVFFTLSIVLIVHIVGTGKMLSQEKYKKVIWVSLSVFVVSLILINYRFLSFYIYYLISN